MAARSTSFPFCLCALFCRIFLAIIVACACSTSAGSAADYTVGIVRDGPSWYFDTLIKQFKAELTALSEGERGLVFRDHDHAAYAAAQVNADLGALLADDSVDLVYAAGVIATEHALTRAQAGLNKPVVGGALQLSDIGPSFLSEAGTSTLANYTFIASPRRVVADLERLSQLTHATKIHILIDEVYLPVLQTRLQAAQARFAADLALDVAFVLAGESAQACLDQLPTGAEAVYVTTVPRISDAELERLYQGLAERRLPSLAMSGRRGVENGALFGLAPDNIKAVARRAALNVHFIALGQPLDELPVYLPMADHLLINAATANEIGWSPDYDTSLVAEFVHQEFRLSGEPMDLAKAMLMGQQQNIAVSIAREQQSLSHSDVGLARSALRPQLNALGQTSYTRYDDRIDRATTPQYADQSSVGLQLKQILFNDELFTNLNSRKELEEAAQYDTMSSELDALESAALAYFNYLRSEMLYTIERDNLRLSENHYQLAQLRVEIGSADPSEVYRLEQLRSQARASLISRETERMNAQIAFNRVVGADRAAQWSFQPVTLGERELFFMDAYLQPHMREAGTFRKLGPFLKAYAVDNSPELMAFDRQIAAQGLLLEQKQRRYYLPEVALTADLTHFNKGSEFADSDSENQGMAALNVSFPIFEGGRRRHDVLRQKTVIRLLQAQREQAVQQLEELALTSFNGILSAHPNIRLSRRALQAATKNYDSVMEKYSQGAASILDLLDAQETLLSQRQSAAVAVYDYLSAIHRLQRSIAWFEFQKAPAAKEAWVELFDKFLKENP